MTIKDLAALTGYSVGTVSRVLNNQPHVSETAREVILRAAQESGFQLNTNAQQLKQQHGTSILVICKSSTNELFDSLLVAIQSRIARTSFPLILDYIDERDNEVHRAIRLCQEKKPLAILFLGGQMANFQKDFHQISVPCVLVTSSAAGLEFPNLSSVCVDDNDAAQLVIDQMISMGHRRFAVVGGDRKNSDTVRLRYEGCLEAFRRIWEGVCVNNWNRQDVDAAMGLVEALLGQVPVYELACTPDETAVKALEAQLRKQESP